MKPIRQSILSILPPCWREAFSDRQLEQARQIHLRLGKPVTVETDRETEPLNLTAGEEELRFVLNLASRYSPWNASTMAKGYLTAPGGHRIGICGEATETGFRSVTSLCIRVARDLPGIAGQVPLGEDLLVIGPPGSGKTTLLRDLCRRISRTEAVAVVDERCELFPLWNGVPAWDSGPNTDVLLGKSKGEGIDMVLRSMGPRWIAVDEITREEDCRALGQAAWCGVHLLASAHAGSVDDLCTRPVYRPLLENGLFRRAVVLHNDKSYHMERIGR